MKSYAELGANLDPVARNQLTAEAVDKFGIELFEIIETQKKQIDELLGNKPELIEKPKRNTVNSKRKPIPIDKKLQYRLAAFKRTSENTDNFTVQHFLDKFSDPVCYLTGIPINIYDFSSYHLEHVIPLSRGGDSNLSNLQLAVPWANIIKGDMSLDVLLDRCKMIVDHLSVPL
jgi:5-methylcytosine-specific restriction endonuclease McrA